MAFRLLIDFDVLDFVANLPASQRHRLYVHFRDIQKFPGNYSDYVEPDDEGRLMNVSVFNGLRILYWTDRADRHVKILHILKNE